MESALNNERHASEAPVTAGFYEPFTAANAIQALNRVGFEDQDIGIIGLLAGPPAHLSCFCESIGMPVAHARFYEATFEEGGMLLLVRARELPMKQIALAVLNEQGGLFPPTIQ